mgnify:CR=1 FL=1
MFVSSVCREQPLHRHTSMKRCVSTYSVACATTFSILELCLWIDSVPVSTIAKAPFTIANATTAIITNDFIIVLQEQGLFNKGFN